MNKANFSSESSDGVGRHCTGITPSTPQHTVQEQNIGEKERKRELEQLLLAFYDINSAVPETSLTWQQLREESS